MRGGCSEERPHARASLWPSGKPANHPDSTERAIAIPGRCSVRRTRRPMNRDHPTSHTPRTLDHSRWRSASIFDVSRSDPRWPKPGRSCGRRSACASHLNSTLDPGQKRDPYVSGAICRTPGHRPLRTGGTVVKGANPKVDSTALRGPKTAQATQEPWPAVSTSMARRSGWFHRSPWVETHDVDSFGNGCSAPGVDSLSARSDCPARRTAQEGVGRALLHAAVALPRPGLRYANVPMRSMLWCWTNPGHRVRKRTSLPYGQVAVPVCSVCSSPERDRPTSHPTAAWGVLSACPRAAVLAASFDPEGSPVARPPRVQLKPRSPGDTCKQVLPGGRVLPARRP